MITLFRKAVPVGLLALALLAFSTQKMGAEEKRPVYVGSEACRSCHEEEYSRFTTNARKAHSFQSVLKMKQKLTPQELEGCFACHTTGYGQPGGFRSLQETPHLKDTGCEVCHGPGSLHVQSEDRADLTVKVSVEVCAGCHVPERIKAFRYKPMLYAGAH